MKKFSFIVNGHVKSVEGIALLKPAKLALIDDMANLNSEFQEGLRQAAALRIEPNTTQPTLLVYRAREDN